MASLDRQEAGTPRKLFDVLHAEHCYTIDACASAHNAKLPAYLTKEDDALALSWAGERVWCNPPYDNIAAWLAHALEPEIVVYLLPVRTDRLWWMEWRPRAEVHWFVGEKPHRRIQFEAPPGVRYTSNPDCNCLMCFGEGFKPGMERWRSGNHGELLVQEIRDRGAPDHAIHFVKALREETGCSLRGARHAAEQSGWDYLTALRIIGETGLA